MNIKSGFIRRAEAYFSTPYLFKERTGKHLFQAVLMVFSAVFFLNISHTAQAQFNDPFELNKDTEKSILSAGFTHLDYRHPSPFSDVPYLFENSMYAIRLSSGNKAGLMFRYGEDEINYTGGAAADVRLINVAAELGGSKTLYRSVGDRGNMIYIPLRVMADYFNMKNDFNPTATEQFQSDVLNQIIITGGIGLGGRYRTSSRSVVSDRILIDAYLMRSLGTSMQINEDIFYGAARQDHFKAQLTFLDIFSGYSLVIGYEFRNAVFRQEGFHSFVSMLSSSDDYESEYFAHTITVGLRLSRR
jgi:hypothetical protein